MTRSENMEHVEVLRELLADEYQRGDGSPSFTSERAALEAAIAALSAPQPPAEAQPVALDYVPGELDRTSPPRIWLQIDVTGNNSERDDEWPGPDYVTWQDESVGGLEIQYVRADLAPPPSAPVGELPRYDAGLISDFGGGNVEWWQDYIRAELDRAHDFYNDAIAQQPAADEALADTQRAIIEAAERRGYERAQSEIARLQEEIDNRWAQGVHTCHENCQRVTCVQKREIEAMRAVIDNREAIIATHAADTREYQKQLMHAQARAERLAEALREIEGFTLSQFAGPHDMAAACIERAARALLRDQEAGA